MFKFTIRDLLWLLLVVAIMTAWWIDRSNLIAAYRGTTWEELDAIWKSKKPPVPATDKTDGDFLD
ncbi:MAG TPA: hypothetical protein VFB96_04075 [Pirellulaceae bacterium]|nr:hypothetical protein [Pirellulaceae bacterium]